MSSAGGALSSVLSSASTGQAFYVVEEGDLFADPFTSLLEAVHEGNMARVRELCKSGLDVNASQSPMPPMTPPLIEAVAAGRRDMVDFLLDQSASLQARDVAYGGTVLHWAAARGDADLLAYLLERAVDVDSASFSGQTALHVAAGAGHERTVRLLLSDSAQPDLVDLKGDTPLHEASGAGHVPVVAALLAGRANPNIANSDTETPLLRAARRGYSGVVEELLAKGAAVDAVNSAGVTALISSAFFGHEPVVRHLLQRGANPRSAARADRRTALHWAAMNDHDAVCQALLGWASDTSRLLDAAGARPLDLAMQADARRVIQLLNRL